MRQLFFPSAGMRQLGPWLLVLAGAAIAVGAYLQALNYPLVSDDAGYVARNTRLAALPLSELWRLFGEPYNSFSEFLPLRDISYWFDLKLFGTNPAELRLHNIALYLLCLPLVYAVTLKLWRYFRPADMASSRWAAAAVTALFALNPVLVESVVWISGRKYVLPNLFAMLAFWFAVRAGRGRRQLAASYGFATLAAFAAVMLAKASYVAVSPVIALLWMIFWLDNAPPDRRREQLLWSVSIVLLAGLLVWIFIASSTGTEPAYFGIESAVRVLAVLGWLARLAVSPEARHFFYPVFEDRYLPEMVALGGAVLIAAMTGALLLLRRRSLEGFALAAFLLLCVPYLQLIPYAAPSLVSDRFAALAVWPAVLLLVALAWRCRPVPRAILLLAVALAWGYQTVERTRDWAAPIDADLRAYPGYYMPAYEKIVVLQLPRRLYDGARETASGIADPVFREIMSGVIDMDYAVNVSAVLTGKPGEAMDKLWKFGLRLDRPPEQARWNSPVFLLWEKSKELLTDNWASLARYFPDDPAVRYNAGLWMLKMHNKGAVDNLRAAVESQRLPQSVRGTAYKNLGLALIYSGTAAAAEAPLLAALQQSPPDFRAYCLLAGVYKRTGRNDEAARAEAACYRRVPAGPDNPTRQF